MIAGGGTVSPFSTDVKRRFLESRRGSTNRRRFDTIAHELAHYYALEQFTQGSQLAKLVHCQLRATDAGGVLIYRLEPVESCLGGVEFVQALVALAGVVWETMIRDYDLGEPVNIQASVNDGFKWKSFVESVRMSDTDQLNYQMVVSLVLSAKHETILEQARNFDLLMCDEVGGLSLSIH